MKLLLVSNNGQTVAQVDDVERYDGTLPGHAAGLLDLLETLIAFAKSSHCGEASLAVARTDSVLEFVSPR